MLKLSKLVIIFTLILFVKCAPKREIVIQVAEKLNQLLDHFSKVLEMGVNEKNELTMYAKEDIFEGDSIFT